MANYSAYNNGICAGRLTLTDGTAVTTSDVTAATTLYLEAYKGEYVSLYTGSTWVSYNIASGLSIAVPATTVTMYDVFLDYADGTPALALTAWTNDTTRATALTLQDGVYVKTGDTQQRYLGSFRTTGVSGQTEDSLTKRYLFNYYNRVARPLRRKDTTDTWAYSSTTLQQANASAANQVEIVTGLVEDAIDLYVIGNVANNDATPRNVQVGIGIDATNANGSGTIFAYTSCISTIPANVRAEFRGFPSVGYHYYAWLEAGAGAGTQTWRGDFGAGGIVETGMAGICFG
jgi:hypothetical protein